MNEGYLGNKNREKFPVETVLLEFEELLKKAKNGEFLCMEDVILASPYYRSTFFWLVKNHEELKDVKQAINDSLISKINKNALENKYNPASSIWRLKMLGEREIEIEKPKEEEKTLNINVCLNRDEVEKSTTEKL